ncbi:MAG: hypothetical protein IKS48_05065 [Eubacterium sp.]|nr:hypothetical protein [Eubacterium sp.]
MSRIFDKIIIHILTVFAMCYIMHGNTFLVVLYTSIILSGVNYYLISREDMRFKMNPEGAKEWCAFVLEILAALLSLFYPNAVLFIPIIMYDTVRSRNYYAAGVSVIGLLKYFNGSETDVKVFLYILSVTVLSVMLSVYTEEKNVVKREYRRLRDDSVEKNTLLRSQNTELIKARDTEIYNAQLSERNRIAREIHDNVGHTLSRAILQMGALLAIHKEEPVHSELEGVRQTLDDAMNSIRSSVHNMHDDSIDVMSNLTHMAEPLKNRFNLHMDIDIGDDTPRQIKYAIIGITKECISNIIKHSHNTDVDIRLNEHPSMYQLIIHDYNSEKNSDEKDSRKNVLSGTGILNDPGMGLENIRGRVESTDGKLNISTENGFRVFVTIPRKE